MIHQYLAEYADSHTRRIHPRHTRSLGFVHDIFLRDSLLIHVLLGQKAAGNDGTQQDGDKHPPESGHHGPSVYTVNKPCLNAARTNCITFLTLNFLSIPYL